MVNLQSITSVANLLWKGIKNNKAGKIIVGDFTDAIQNEVIDYWKKVKPLFIKEDEELVADIENEPNDADNQAAFRRATKRIAKRDDLFAKDLETFFQQISKLAASSEKNINITGDHNIVVNENQHSTVSINIDKDK